MNEQHEAEPMKALLDEIIALESKPFDFKPMDPPPEIQTFVDTASLHQLQGVLLEVLAAMKDRAWAPGGLMARFLLVLVEK